MDPDPSGDDGGRRAVRVFISAKSADYEYADQVYRSLRDAGVAAFFSRESLPDRGIADYRREIDRALDEAEHLVVVTSAVEHVLAPWVEAEWGFFINEQRSGRKHGNLVTVLVGELAPASLPPSLRYNEVIPLEPGSVAKLLRYVGGSLALNEPAAAPAPISPPSRRRHVFRETATFGGPPGVRMLAAAPDQSILAAGGLDGGVRIYDAATHARRAVLGSARYWTARHEGLITSLAFSRWPAPGVRAHRWQPAPVEPRGSAGGTDRAQP